MASEQFHRHQKFKQDFFKLTFVKKEINSWEIKKLINDFLNTFVASHDIPMCNIQ